MAKISAVSSEEMNDFIESARTVIRGKNSLAEGAQVLTDLVYGKFKDSVVLARFFATVAYGELPDKQREFVDELAAAKGISDQITENTLVLSLLGTSGMESSWNNRKDSQGHVGIPLASAEFVGLIPMISRLLKALGVPLDVMGISDKDIVIRALGKVAGVFYVPDAKTSVDEHNRKIIAMQDFVDQYKVKTVFGIGGAYRSESTVAVLIAFTRESIEKSRADEFMPLINYFKGATANLVSQGKIFD